MPTRFAILHHEVAGGEHWDLMLERKDVLLTWQLEREPADLVFSDLVMPGRSGLELLEFVRREHPGTDFILVTGNASVESAVGALRMGAADYLTKPVDVDEVALVAERTLGRRRLLAENARLRDEIQTLESCQALMGAGK